MKVRRFLIAAFAALAVTALAVTGSLAIAAGGGADDVTSESAPETDALLTYEEAVAQGHPAVKDFQKPPGMPYCESPMQWQVPNPKPPTNDDAQCFVRPEDQGLRFVPGGSVPGNPYPAEVPGVL